MGKSLYFVKALQILVYRSVIHNVFVGDGFPVPSVNLTSTGKFTV